jgi:hypothetical protein
MGKLAPDRVGKPGVPSSTARFRSPAADIGDGAGKSKAITANGCPKRCSPPDNRQFDEAARAELL